MQDNGVRHSKDSHSQHAAESAAHVPKNTPHEHGHGGRKPHHPPQPAHGDHTGDSHDMHAGHERLFFRRFWICLILSLPVLLYSPMLQAWLGFSMPVVPGSQSISPFFSVIIFLYGGVPFLKMALPELRRREPGMMTLISLAISVAFFYSLAATFIFQAESFYWELVTLIDIMLFGHWIEMRSVRRASRALDELASLMPNTAERIRNDGGIESVPTSSLALSDLLLIRPGASVPADGEVVEGASHVNEAMITGESQPLKKSAGSKVIAGTINGEGSLRVKVTAIGEETALAGIMRLVDQAQKSKSRTQVLADRAAGWLFFVALGVAGVTAVAWILFTGFGVHVIARVATVLVIACPHALGLAIPLVVAITTSLGARNGILVRDRLAMEMARDVDIVIFDKTGTLTLGEFGVVDSAITDGWEPHSALALAAAVEGDSEHRIAQGFRLSAKQAGVTLPAVSEFEALKGLGVRAISEGKTVYLGGPRLLEANSFQLPPQIAQLQTTAGERGQTAVFLIVEGDTVASFALADVIRPESRPAVEKLQEMNIEVALLTGDSEAVARSVAEKLGIDTFFAEVLPEDKDKKVMQLQEQGQRVAMVGDGVNDAPALARADVGIAIGSGTDVAVESAHIILVNSNPLDAVKVIALSRASYRKMVQNLIWAAGYNVFALPLAAGVLAPINIILSPAVGALLMSLSTVIVALNAQLLRRFRLADL